jgi:hypothetical protein
LALSLRFPRRAARALSHFREAAVYLPVSMRVELPLVLDDKHKWDMVSVISYDYGTLKMKGQ